MARKNASEATETNEVLDAETSAELENEVDNIANGEKGLLPDGTPRKRIERGTSENAQVRNAFAEIMGEFVTSGGVNLGTLEQFRELFEAMPLTGVGIPPEAQLANIDEKLQEMYTSGKIDEELLKKLLNRKFRIKKAIEEAAKEQPED